MRSYKVTFEDGNSLVTGFNGSFHEVENYYINQTFNVGHGEEDLMVKAVKVEELKSFT
jgi:hypothetical protein